MATAKKLVQDEATTEALIDRKLREFSRENLHKDRFESISEDNTVQIATRAVETALKKIAEEVAESLLRADIDLQRDIARQVRFDIAQRFNAVN